jgi:CheY-like chemotaxis protein
MRGPAPTDHGVLDALLDLAVQSRLKILLVEDDEVDVMTVRRALDRADVEHDLAIERNGGEALTKLEASARGEGPPLPSVMIFDLNLPRLSGLELLARVKQAPGLVAIPAVILTTSAQESDVARAFELGAAGYFVKPVDFDRFVEVMSTLCRYWSVATARPPSGTEQIA